MKRTEPFKPAITSAEPRQESRSSIPRHYQIHDPEPIVVIEQWKLGFHLGNVLKYIARAKYKGDEIRDLKKAAWYLNRHIALLQSEQEGRNAPKPEDQV
jgi:hypothetical protein